MMILQFDFFTVIILKKKHWLLVQFESFKKVLAEPIYLIDM